MSLIDITSFGMFLSDRREASALSFFAWIVLGMVVGLIGSKLLNRTRRGLARDLLLGIVGGVVGGFLSNLFRESGVNSLNLYSLFVAVVGATVFLIIYHARSLVGGRSLS
jgi:uncharacterized membrane protein YeaQ/YmgE (transglycosylase-associated protein family)